MIDEGSKTSWSVKWWSPVAIVFTILLAGIIFWIDTSIIVLETLTEISGEQPGFARTIGGERFGDQIEFEAKGESGKRCVLSTIASRETRQQIVSGSQLVVLCDFTISPAQVYQVTVDEQVLVAYQDTIRAISFQNRLKKISLVVLGGILVWQLMGYVRNPRMRKKP